MTVTAIGAMMVLSVTNLKEGAEEEVEEAEEEEEEAEEEGAGFDVKLDGVTVGVILFKTVALAFP